MNSLKISAQLMNCMISVSYTHLVTIETYNSHAVDKYLRVLSLLGVENLTHHGMRTYTCEEWDRRADEFFAGEGIKEGAKLVGLSVGSSTPEKNWPAENFGKVAEHFARRSMIPVFFGVKSELPLDVYKRQHLKWWRWERPDWIFSVRTVIGNCRSTGFPGIYRRQGNYICH